jgi:hypothetical protein
MSSGPLQAGGGSDSEEERRPPEKKNRRGQRARQKILEIKHGAAFTVPAAFSRRSARSAQARVLRKTGWPASATLSADRAGKRVARL